ncbi:MAG: DUF5615 family PIN-like protein [Candidatus Acidiferrales bacterium]
MRVGFQADADLDARILRGLRRAPPEIDIRSAADAALAGWEDPEVLRIAADSRRILVSQDRRTMPGHFACFSATVQSPGVRHPPQSGWLDELGRLKGGRAIGLGVARCAPIA